MCQVTRHTSCFVCTSISDAPPTHKNVSKCVRWHVFLKCHFIFENIVTRISVSGDTSRMLCALALAMHCLEQPPPPYPAQPPSAAWQQPPCRCKQPDTLHQANMILKYAAGPGFVARLCSSCAGICRWRVCGVCVYGLHDKHIKIDHQHLHQF